MNKKLVERQVGIKRFIAAYTAENGYSPTIRDIAEKFGISVGTVFRDLKHMEESGEVARHSGMARTVRVI